MTSTVTEVPVQILPMAYIHFIRQIYFDLLRSAATLLSPEPPSTSGLFLGPKKSPIDDWAEVFEKIKKVNELKKE